METDNLRTASSYINNLLLSRGLLRNGQPLEFAQPQKGEGGTEGTMAKVMSLVNDLVLRRDRDCEQRESLSQAIRAVRADTVRQTTDLERLQAKHAEAQRRLGLAEATERALKTQLRSAEHAARSLKEEMGRMRVLVGQTRASCANEVRKRERVIEGLKKHVGEGGRARGTGKAVGVATVTVVAGIGADEGPAKALTTNDSGYDLRMETNEFLTELSRGLSEENENLGGLMRRTIETLTTLSGWEKDGVQGGGMVVSTDNGFENISSEMDSVIEHLRTLLTNPSFVPLEEVEVREEEIVRLREGWEKMEARWREAVQMMDGWRKRMTKSGQTVKLEELDMGLRLSPLKVAGVDDVSDRTGQESNEEEGDTQADIDAMDDSQVPALVDPTPGLDDLESDASEFEDIESSAQSPARALGPHVEDMSQSEEEDRGEQAEEEEEPTDEEHLISSVDSSSASPNPPLQLSPLRETPNTGNRGHSFTTIIEENTWDLAQIDRSSNNLENSVLNEEDVSLSKPTPTQRSPRKASSTLHPTGSSRLPRPASSTVQQSPLTTASIAAKLAATEREADAARVRAKLRAAKLSSANSATTLKPPSASDEHHARERGKEEKEEPPRPTMTEEPSRKRKPTSRSHGGRLSRRRSTLSPWELESLILGSTGTGV
ncbi:MAG: hypothetical protein M1818_006422 [Claussenomyces sp. TS43310]|nr:MAG: hypothetical protein M1818_006422 [Claussenomyces sp. TS43310]